MNLRQPISALKMGVVCLSNLYVLAQARRVCTARKYCRTSSRGDDLRQWNDPLAYRTGLPAQPAARIRLIQPPSHFWCIGGPKRRGEGEPWA